MSRRLLFWITFKLRKIFGTTDGLASVVNSNKRINEHVYTILFVKKGFKEDTKLHFHIQDNMKIWTSSNNFMPEQDDLLSVGKGMPMMQNENVERIRVSHIYSM